MGSFSIWHWLIFALVVLLIFGLRRSPVASSAPSNDGLASSWALPLPRGDQDTYSRAERLRDDLAQRWRAIAEASGAELTSYESYRSSGAVWLRLELRKPDPARPELSLRSVIAVTIDRFDFHRFEHVLRVEVGRGPYRRTVNGLTELKEEDMRALTAFATGATSTFPRLRSKALRQLGWQLWRPTNRITRIRRDRLVTSINALGALLLLVGAVSLMVQLDASAESCEIEGQCPDASFGMLALLLGSAAMATSLAIVRRRCTLVLNTGKPNIDPRSLVRMDSWQVTLTGLGARQKSVLEAILNDLTQRQPPGVTMRPEWIGYASVDNKVEREQVVLTFRRAIAFLRLESYGTALYLGWDSHINAGVWAEQDIGRGIDRISGRPVVARRVVQGWQGPTEYDVSDVSFITEWLHACIVRVLKQQLAEYRIDQEIDFTIQRESRADALRSTRPEAEKKASRFGAGLVKRTA